MSLLKIGFGWLQTALNGGDGFPNFGVPVISRALSGCDARVF
jgi:hypothetical protein